jgi:hypothetical protein
VVLEEFSAQAQHLGQRERLRSACDLVAAALQVREACAVLCDKLCADGKVRATVFARIGISSQPPGDCQAVRPELPLKFAQAHDLSIRNAGVAGAVDLRRELSC